MNAHMSAIILGTLLLGSAGALETPAIATPGVWEPFGLDGYDVLALTQHDAYIFAAVYPSPAAGQGFGHGVWRRHEHPDSTWVQLGLEGIGVISIWVRPDDPTIIYASALTSSYPQANGHLLFRTLNGGTTWSALEPGPQAFSSRTIVGTPNVPTEMLMSADDVVHRSTDAGETWIASSNSAGALLYDSVEASTVWTTVYTGFEEGVVYRSLDDGQNWEERHRTFGVIGNLAVAPTGRTYVVRGGGVWSSDDDGDTWVVLDPGATSLLRDVDVSPLSQNFVLTAEWPLLTNSTLYLSGDAGSTWSDIGATIPDFLTFPDVLASSTEPRVFYVAVEGWDHTNTFAGVWRYEAETVVAIPESTLPTTVRPQLAVRENPVRDVAMFTLSVPSVDVETPLRVFDAQGRVVAELGAWQSRAAGAEITWDGTTSDGARVTPGVYFGVVETDRGRGTSRFVWLD